MSSSHGLKLSKTANGAVVQQGTNFYQLPETDWNELLRYDDLFGYLSQAIQGAEPLSQQPAEILAPIGDQEVWAAGVTYFRSRTARMEESKDGGGGAFYDRVYDADRPELFFKSTAKRVVGPKQPVRIRKDSLWNVPEPELALLISASGQITGYTIGNDMSSRDIEGENPLYLPQAKVYDGACALGPAILVTNDPLSPDTAIQLRIERGGAVAFSGETSLAQMKRTLPELAGFLFRELSFEHGCFLLTGTGIVPHDEFTLQSGDTVHISIGGIGTLTNNVA